MISVKNHTNHNYIALKICLWQNFEMAEITNTPVQATQVKSVIFNKLFVARKAMEISVKNHANHNYIALKIYLRQNFEMAEITNTPVQATQVNTVIFNKLFVA